VVGSYLAVHGAQKLFGAFGGPGLDKAGAGFHRIGLRPGKHMAAAAGITELGGGILTAAGIADPAGPLAIMGAMTVAATTHRAKGPLNARGGFELPLTNLAAAATLAAVGPGKFPHRPLAAAAAGRGGCRGRQPAGGWRGGQDAHRGTRGPGQPRWPGRIRRAARHASRGSPIRAAIPRPA